MKRWLPAILLICILAVVAWYFASRGNNQSAPNPNIPVDSNTPVATLHNSKAAVVSGKQEATTAANGQSNPGTSPAPKVPSAPAKPLPYIVGSADAPPTDIEPQILLENMRRAIINYGSTFSGNPVGNNSEIAAALNGENPKQIKFIDPEKGLRINGNGELVDSWGTPFFFHQLSATDTEVRSAGPDKIMWTADDLVIK